MVATGDGEGEGVSREKSSNLFGERSRWAELPDFAGVSKVSTPKLDGIHLFVMHYRKSCTCEKYLGASGVTAWAEGFSVM